MQYLYLHIFYEEANIYDVVWDYAFYCVQTCYDFFFFKNLLFWWQALDGVLVEPPEMGLLGNSGKKVTNDCIALIHLHIQPIYLSNIFVFLWASFKSTRYICLEMLYRFNRIIHLHNQKIYFSNMVVFLYTPSQCSFDRYICQILFPFFDSPTQ